MLRQRIRRVAFRDRKQLGGRVRRAGVGRTAMEGIPAVEGLAGDFTTRAFCVASSTVLSSLGVGEAPLLVGPSKTTTPAVRARLRRTTPQRARSPWDAFPTGHAHPPVHPGCRCLSCPFGRRLQRMRVPTDIPRCTRVGRISLESSGPRIRDRGADRHPGTGQLYHGHLWGTCRGELNGVLAVLIEDRARTCRSVHRRDIFIRLAG